MRLRCVKCDHEWLPRVQEVRQCPRCKTYYWKKKKKDKKKSKKE
jgi:Zn finger protein HypA/HybF involved in hydrogenase expression